MKPRRFFIEGEALGPGERLVTGKRARHLTRVLRLRVGEAVVLFDGSGSEYPAQILEVGRQLVRFKVAAGTRIDRESSLDLVLALGLSRPRIMDFIVQKVTELGVNAIIPVKSERAQRWSAGDRGASRLKRWERIAQEAARQSGRNLVPHVSPPADFSQLLANQKGTELKLICWEEEDGGSLRTALAEQVGSRQACVLIGPEGGFSTHEVEQATAAGFQCISLGQRVLRTETAAITVISLLQYELGDLGLLP
jgi:16S rRNA (uracil1498-N3)-methyltransferase